MADDKIINPYTDVALIPITPADPVTTQAGSANIPAVDEMTVGVGDEVFHANREGIWLGASAFANALFSVTLGGIIRGISGFIGGFEIGSTYLRDVGNTFGLSSVVSGADDIRIWAGTTYADRANAEFWVTEAGVIRAQSGTIGGWSLTATTFSSGGISLDSTAETITVGSGTPNIVIDGANKRIRTSTYSAGLRGFSLEGDTGNAEFNNINARGEFHSQVLSYGEIHSMDGSSVISKSSAKLKNDVTTVTSPTTFNVDVDDPSTGHFQRFEVSDVLRIKDGSGNDNWMTVSSVSDQTTFYRYVCVKNDGTNGTFRAGAAVVNYGQSGDGIIENTVDGSNTPRMSIYTHAGSPWSVLTEQLRVGNLNGFLDYASKIFGFAAGSTDDFVAIDPTNGVRATGKIVSQDRFTTGLYTPAGSAVAIESDGLLYRTRATALSTKNTEQTLTTAVADPTGFANRLYSVSSTMRALFYVPAGGVGAALILKQFTIDPTSATITSVTSTTLSETTDARSGHDAVMITSSDAVVVWQQGSAIRARYVAGVDGTVSLGTGISVGAFGSRPSIVKVSSTEFLVIYSNGNDIKATSVSISGTTLTAGSAYTILSNGNTNVPMFADRFGSTTAYALTFNDTTNTKAYIMAFTFSGTTMTAGTPVQIVNYGGAGFAIVAKSSYLANTTASQMGAFVRFNDTGGGSGGDSVYLYTYNLSGTTLTLGVQTVVEHIGAVLANSNQVTLTKIGNYTYAIGYDDSTTTTVGRLYRLTGDTFSVVGSELTHTGITADTAITNIFCYYSPARILMVGTSSTSANGFVKTVDFTTNYSGTVGVITSAAALSASALTILNGENTNVTGLTIGTEYYADLDGALTTSTLGGTKRIGVANDTTKIIVQV